MSGLLGRLGNPVQRAGRWLQGRFDPNRASEEAGIRWIAKLGMLSDRLSAITEMSFDETISTEVDQFINWSAQTWEASIPYLKAKDDQRMHRKVLAYLRQHSTFLRIKARLEKNRNMREILLEEISYSPESFPNLDTTVANEIRETIDSDKETEEENMKLTQMDRLKRELKIGYLIERLPQEIQSQLSRYAVESLEAKMAQCRYDMLRYSKLLIALSFGKEDVQVAPPLVFSKNEVPQQVRAPPQVRDSGRMQELEHSIKTLEYYASRNKRN